MYEMYPEAWPTTVAQRPQTGSGDKPRRRVRKGALGDAVHSRPPGRALDARRLRKRQGA